jgi:hypothetical protein
MKVLLIYYIILNGDNYEKEIKQSFTVVLLQ